jgi:DNA-binding MarR family transcriptional regulator
MRQLAAFRYQLRRFLRFSEATARAHGLTPLQHQLLLGIAGFTGRGWATITELAEFLQARHNAVVGLVQRAERRALVRKEHGSSDQRFVRVYLLPKGQRILAKLSQLHQKEVQRFEHGFLNLPAADALAGGEAEGKAGLQGQHSASKSQPRKRP